jgi:hypothetical protein
MSRRTYPIPNKNLSGSDYIQNKRAKQLFSGTSNLAKTIEEQNGNFPLLTPLGKQKPYQGTFGLSGRMNPNEKTYCLNTSHSYRDLLAITKGKYLITPPNIANESDIELKDVSNSSKLYNGLYYIYTYPTTNALVYMNPGYPLIGGYPMTQGDYIENKINYDVSSDANQRIIVDPSYIITYTSQSCVLHPHEARGVRINNDYESKYSFNRTINLDLFAGFQYPVKFSLDYESGDCINSNNDMQTKYANPVIPPIPPQTIYYNAGGQGTNQAIIAWSNDGATWTASDNGNTIFKSEVNCIKFDGISTWLAVGGNSTDTSGNVIARSTNGKFWQASAPAFPSPILENPNNIFVNAKGAIWDNITSKWVVVGLGKQITDPSGVLIQQPSVAYSFNGISWTISTSTDPSLNNPFGVSGVGNAIAVNDISGMQHKMLAVGTGTKGATNINMVASSNGLSWSVVTTSPFINTSPPFTIIYSSTTTPPPYQSKWIVGGTATNPTISPIYYSIDNGVTWSAAIPPLGSGGTYNGICYDIAYRNIEPSILSLAKYVAVGVSIFGLSNIMYSFDGINWSTSSNGNLFSPRSVTYYSGIYQPTGLWVAAGSSGGYNVVGYSTNGDFWFISPNANGIFQSGALSVGSVGGI